MALVDHPLGPRRQAPVLGEILSGPISQQNVENPESTLRSRAFVVVLVLAAVVGVIASLAAWCFLELLFYVQQWVFTDIPNDLGYDHGAPLWWYLPVLAFAALVAAFAIVRLPGSGGHVPAEGLKASPTHQPLRAGI